MHLWVATPCTSPPSVLTARTPSVAKAVVWRTARLTAETYHRGHYLFPVTDTARRPVSCASSNYRAALREVSPFTASAGTWRALVGARIGIGAGVADMGVGQPVSLSDARRQIARLPQRAHGALDSLWSARRYLFR